MAAGRRGSHLAVVLAAAALIAAPAAARAAPPPGWTGKPASPAPVATAAAGPLAQAPSAPLAQAPSAPLAQAPSAPLAQAPSAPGPTASRQAPSGARLPDRAEQTESEDGVDGWTPGKLWSLGGLAGLYTGVGVWAYFAWYNGKPRNPGWEWNGDGAFGVNTYAGGSDKLGHFYSTLVITRATTELLRAGGWRQLPASLIASGLAATYFTLIEVKDAYYYEFSTGDLVADLAGAGLGVLMINRPEIDRLIDIRVDYWPTDEYIDGFKDGDVNFVEDYSGQTYLLALHLSGIPKLTDSRWLRWGRYVDLVGGFQSLNYKPEPADPDAMESQHLFFGVALNVQGVLEELYGRPSGRGARTSHRVLHNITEYVSVPYTTLRITEAQRSREDM